MKFRIFALLMAAALLLTALVSVSVLPAAAEAVEMTPMHGEQFRPDGVTFGRVSFIVPGGTHTEASWEKQIPFFMETLFYGL